MRVMRKKKIMNNLIKGQTQEWEIVVGLEVHAQVKSNSKLFSSSSTTFGSSPTVKFLLLMLQCQACCR